MNSLLDAVRDVVRSVMRAIAKAINVLSGGNISPNSITVIGLLGHVLVGLLIADGNLLWAAGLLVFFGLFDTLDGQLAQIQKRTSVGGMLLDASTDRIKEVILYSAAAYYLVSNNLGYFAVWGVLACGASLCVSYIKAKGETAVAKSNLSVTEVNRLFQDGLMRFEIRMFVLFVGLLSNRLPLALIVIAVSASLTAIARLIRITGKLRD